MQLVESDCLIGGFNGIATFTLPALPADFYSIFLEVKSAGNVSAPIMQFGSSLTVTLTDAGSIVLTSGVASATFSVLTSDKYNQLIVVVGGEYLRDFYVCFAGQKLTRTALTDGVVPSLFGQLVTLPSFLGLKRNFYVWQGRANEYNRHDINASIYGFTLQTPNEVGLKNIVASTSGSFAGDFIPSRKIKTTLPSAKFVIDKPLITTITGYCNCSPMVVPAEVRSINRGLIQFRLSELSGSVVVKRVCTNDYSDDTAEITFTDPADLVSQLTGTFGWQLTYSLGEYSLYIDDACAECDVQEIPYLYTNRNGLTPRPPKNSPSLVCSDCVDYSCYTYFGFNEICVDITRPYACVLDEIFEFTPIGNVGTNSFTFNANFIDRCKDIVSIKWGNSNQLSRYFHLFARISTVKYKTTNEVSMSTKGVLNKLYSQTQKSLTLYTDFMTHDIIDIIIRAFNSDYFAVLINGSWQPVVLEDDLEISEDPSDMPYRSKITAQLTFKEFNILNDFI